MDVTRRTLLQYGSLGLAAAAFPGISQAGTPTSDLQNKLNAFVRQQRKRGIIASNERTSWSVYDFYTKKKLVAINEDRPMQAASMVKVFVAVAYLYLNKQAPHKYPYTSKHRHLMELMLVKSSNNATNQLMRMCRGPANVRRLCQKASRGRYKNLSIVEYIPALGRTYKNKASAHDYSRVLYDLWHNRLPGANEIKRIMSLDNRDRIETGKMPSTLTIYDKTGSTGMLCGNMGIIQLGTSRKAYTFIGIIEKSRKTRHYGSWIHDRGDAIRQVSELVYSDMMTRYKILRNLNS